MDSAIIPKGNFAPTKITSEGEFVKQESNIKIPGSTKPARPGNPLEPYMEFAKSKIELIKVNNYDCDGLASDIFGSSKPLGWYEFFKLYMLKSGFSEQDAINALREDSEFFKETFKMLTGKKRTKITKNLFLNKLKNDGICPSVSVMPKKSGYQMQGETQTCGIQNKNNILTILVIVLILLSIFYLLNKKKK